MFKPVYTGVHQVQLNQARPRDIFWKILLFSILKYLEFVVKTIGNTCRPTCSLIIRKQISFSDSVVKYVNISDRVEQDCNTYLTNYNHLLQYVIFQVNL